MTHHHKLSLDPDPITIRLESSEPTPNLGDVFRGGIVIAIKIIPPRVGASHNTEGWREVTIQKRCSVC